MKNFNPKVSIIIPVYNGSNYLKQAIDSALAQTYKNIEVIVINDGSNDNNATEKIAKSYGNKIKYFKKENGGVATALNLGIDKMTGEYFSWLSHDDMYYAKKIKVQIEFLSKLEDKNVVLFSSYELVDEKGKFIEPCIPNRKILKKASIYSLLRGYVNGITMLIPAEVFKKHGKFDVSLRSTQDYDMWYRVFNSYKFIHLEQILAKTRIHLGRGTVTDPRMVKECNALWIRMIKELPDLQKEQIEGSLYNFYLEMVKFLKNTPYDGAIEYCNDQLMNIEKNILENIKHTDARITIITPTYNRADFIKLTMQSVLNQKFKDYIYVILDDGSSDDTNNIVTKFINGKKNWFYLYHENMGESATVNKGWGLCNSEYFIQVNSDDLIEPDLCNDMVETLDQNPNGVLSYPDFYIIDKNGKTISDLENSDFNLIKDLSMFSCYAACPGAFIRKSALKKWKFIRDEKYKYISDINMLWNMALHGDFIHVPKFLASWRSHTDGISTDRYKSIAEIDLWVEEFFSQDKLPEEVKNIEIECRRSIYNHYARLMNNSNLDYKVDMSNYYTEKAKLPIPRYSNLQVGDNDLIGNKFNGHNLHINLRKRGVESYHLVINKQSDDKNTYVIGADKHDRDDIKQQTIYTQYRYGLDCINNPLMYDILYNKLFLDTDVVHFHLMHNGLLDLQLLPIISKVKPIVWTMHDNWALLGDYSGCEPSDNVFPSEIKNLSLNFEIKKEAIKNSDITFVVASKYIKNILECSPLFKDKDIVHIPFGLDLDIFYPRDKLKTREELGFEPLEKIILVRGNVRNTKGLDYIEYVMDNIGANHKIHLLVVGGNELVGIPSGVKVSNYGWVNDDEFMAKLYSAADILLMPSKREAFGMMAIEAMACGTIPIVLDGTALPETVNAPSCGVATKRDKKIFCDAVEYFLNNPIERADRSKKCIKYIKRYHGTKTYLDALEKVYVQAIDKHRMTKVYSKIIEDLRGCNETIPRLSIVGRPIPSITRNSKMVDKLGDIYSRTVVSVKTDGISSTIGKAKIKIRNKIIKVRDR